MKTVFAQLASNETLKGLGKHIAVGAQELPDAQSEIQTYRGQLAIMNNDAMQIGICVAKKREYIVDTLEQHIQSSELLVALDGDFIVPATSSIEVNGKMCPDMSKLVALRVKDGEGLVFDQGIWHWTPYAIKETCNVLVGFKEDTPDCDYITDETVEKILIKL